MQRTLDAIGGPVLAARYASAKSAEMADACEKLCDGSAITEPEIRDAGLAWLPVAMRFDEGTTAGSVEQDDRVPDEEAEADVDTGTDEAASDLAATREEEDLGVAAPTQADDVCAAA